jgi:phage terminase large subunit-like protein
VAFDRALAAQMGQQLMARLGAKPPVITVNQSVDVMNPAMQWLEQLVVERRFVHAADPVLTWQASNVVVERNHKGEIYPRKAGGKDSHNKIDGIVAILTAGSRVMVGPAPGSVYQSRGVHTLGEES